MRIRAVHMPSDEIEKLTEKVNSLVYKEHAPEIQQYHLLKRRLRFSFRESFNPAGSFGDKRVIRKGFTKYLLDHFYNGNFYYRVRLTFNLSGTFEDFLRSIVIIDATETVHPGPSRRVIENPQDIIGEILSLVKN